MNSMLMVAGYVSLRHQIPSRRSLYLQKSDDSSRWKDLHSLKANSSSETSGDRFRWRRQDKVRQSQCIISVAVHPGKAACPPPLWDMRRGKACYQVSQVQDEPCVGCNWTSPSDAMCGLVPTYLIKTEPKQAWQDVVSNEAGGLNEKKCWSMNFLKQGLFFSLHLYSTKDHNSWL